MLDEPALFKEELINNFQNGGDYLKSRFSIRVLNVTAMNTYVYDNAKVSNKRNAVLLSEDAGDIKEYEHWSYDGFNRTATTIYE